MRCFSSINFYGRFNICVPVSCSTYCVWNRKWKWI